MNQPPSSIPIFIVLDTNWLIYFAEGQHEEVFNEIYDKLQDTAYTLLVPQNVIDEWRRNNPYEPVAKEIEKEYKAAKSIASYMEESDKVEFQRLLSKYAETKERRINSAKARIDKIDEMIRKFGVIVPVTEEVKDLVLKHGVEKKAPFQNKNGSSDAIIFFSAYQYIKTHPDGAYGNSIFISFNHKDFSDSGNIDKIHPDLEPYLDEIKMKFERNVAKAFKLALSLENDIEEFLFQSWDEYYTWLDNYNEQRLDDYLYSQYEISRGK